MVATYLLRNSLNPSKVVGCTVSLRQLTNKGEEGEPVWLAEVWTVEPHKNGGEIAPVYIHNINVNNLDEAVKEATETISRQVDWEPLDDDVRAPYVYYTSPGNNDTVDVNSNLVIKIKDSFPTAGIDIDSISVLINDFDVTDDVDIKGTPSNYTINWVPSKRVLDYY